ncbi:MAG TPA: D-alanine--D-alanine ligase family protein [Acidimicrobiia bacterium]|jgi:D-alanine-D-alanine ligase|nr:D-alanine--D-alanine ligase family protein [Acidimicrobiia bacterium]
MARVLVLFGGRSAEHEVSCVSAVAVVAALTGAGHEAVPVGIDREGQWWLASTGSDPMEAAGERVSLSLPGGTLEAAGRRIGFDVVFPVLHGPFGEDGTIQGVFEIAGIPYVGCHVMSSAVAMEKDLTKQVAGHAGVPSASWRVVRRNEFDDPSRVADDIGDELGLPVFVKPAELGSSVGITRCETEHELKDGILTALRYGDKVIVEEEVRGREIEVAVLDGPRASVPGEVVVSGWYDYEAKYQDDSSEFVAPADLTDAQIAEVQELARRTFQALECRGLARVDFFLEPDGRGFLLNEVNTMPGFTPISGFPKMWMASGMTYPELCNELVELALRT